MSSILICVFCCRRNKSRIGMSWHVQPRSSKWVGSAQHGSEHSNRQMLASSFLALCMLLFLASLCSDLFFLSGFIFSFRHEKVTSENWPVWDLANIKVLQLTVFCTCDYVDVWKCMMIKNVYLLCLHNKSWPLCKAKYFRFNHVLGTISPESVTAAGKMGISCSINLLPRLCFSCLTNIYLCYCRLAPVWWVK